MLKTELDEQEQKARIDKLRKDAMADEFVVPAGKGIGNVAAIVKDFIARGGSCFTIEPHLAVFDGLSGLEREGEGTKALYTYSTNDEAFDAACIAFKKMIEEMTKNNSQVPINIFRAMENVKLAEVIGYTDEGGYHNFMDNYDEESIEYQ